MTGATLIDNEYGLKLENVELKHFGSAKMIKHIQAAVTVSGVRFPFN